MLIGVVSRLLCSEPEDDFAKARWRRLVDDWDRLAYNRIAKDGLSYRERDGFLREPITQIAIHEQLLRMNRAVEDMRRRLTEHQGDLVRYRMDLPAGVLDELRHLGEKLGVLDEQFHEHEQDRRNLEALAGIGQVVNSSLDLKTVLNEVMDTLIQLTGAERAFLMLREGRSGKMETRVARNWERVSLDTGELQISDTIIHQVLQGGDAVLTTNALTDPRFGAQESIVAYNLRSILCVPLKVKGKLIGVIYADNRVREGLFTEKARTLVSGFANQAAVALENARLFDSVRRTLDEVTELKNLMEDVFASIASGVITADIGDMITLCNQAAGSILATSKESLLGTSLRALLKPLSPDLLEKLSDVEFMDKRYIGLEIHPKIEARGEVDLSLNISPLKMADETTRGVAIVVDDLTEKRRLEAQRRLFERMVSPAVIEQLDPDSLQLGGHRAEITCFFADIRGFTSFSETTDPETLVGVLNRYLAAAADAILQEEGTIDKFLGDAVVAWFNAPIPQRDHAMRAARAALQLKTAISDLHTKLPSQFQLSFGVGIHSGEALLGLVGTQQRLEYTAIGDSVNTAKRLQENALPGQILISRAAAEPIKIALQLKEMPPVMAEGKEQPIEVYELVGLG
jgi:adenylate cyclase